MKLSRHEDVLALHCCFVVKSDLWLVMPLMSKGSCYHVLRCLRKVGRLRDGQGLSEEAIATILRETLLGLDYIHSHGQIHRDIKYVSVLRRRRAPRAHAFAHIFIPLSLSLLRAPRALAPSACPTEPATFFCHQKGVWP